GVKLKSVSLEMTRAPMTVGVVGHRLKWLQELGGNYLHGGITSKNAPLGLHEGNFQKGDK
ncbi:MAG: hypothetical protein ACRBDL_11835, partial [Alphaproteobacteria bacterium]